MRQKKNNRTRAVGGVAQSVRRNRESTAVSPVVGDRRRTEKLREDVKGMSRNGGPQQYASESDGGSDWGQENPCRRNGQCRDFSSSGRHGRHYGDSSDDDSDRSASPTNRRQAVQDRQSRCSERRRRSHRREVNQQSSAAERQNVSQAHEMHSSVWHTGTPRERFGFTVGAKLGTYDGSSCLETFIARFNNCARYIKWD